MAPHPIPNWSCPRPAPQARAWRHLRWREGILAVRSKDAAVIEPRRGCAGSVQCAQPVEFAFDEEGRRPWKQRHVERCGGLPVPSLRRQPLCPHPIDPIPSGVLCVAHELPRRMCIACPHRRRPVLKHIPQAKPPKARLCVRAVPYAPPAAMPCSQYPPPPVDGSSLSSSGSLRIPRAPLACAHMHP